MYLWLISNSGVNDMILLYLLLLQCIIVQLQSLQLLVGNKTGEVVECRMPPELKALPASQWKDDPKPWVADNLLDDKQLRQDKKYSILGPV